MWKQISFVTVAILTLAVLLAFVVTPAHLQDRDPRDYYPDGCTYDNNQWLRAPQAEEFVLTRLNQWRVALGVYPLQRNAQLDLIAAQQASFIAPNAPFGDDRFIAEGDFSAWHTDVLGQGIDSRLERNGWPVYDTGRIIGAEIAAYFPDVSGAINFWQTSSVHSTTVSRPGLREAGVYVMCWRGWLLQYVVMASRPNYVAVTYDPYSNALFLTDESSSFLLPNRGFRPDFVQIRDLGGNRLHEAEWLIWNEVVQLPPNAPDRLVIAFTDGVTVLETEIDINRDRTFPSQPTPTPIPTSTPTQMPTVGPSPTVFVPAPTLVPSPTPPPNNGDNYDIAIYYNEDYVTIVNESGRFANLQPMAIVSEILPPFSRGMSFFALPYIEDGGDLENFAPGACVQAFSRARYDGPGRNPTSCTNRVAWRSALRPGERFWLRPRFEITYGLQMIASCSGLQVRDARMVCGFDLPESAFDN